MAKRKTQMKNEPFGGLSRYVLRREGARYSSECDWAQHEECAWTGCTCPCHDKLGREQGEGEDEDETP